MRAGTLEIVAGPCQFLPAITEDRRSFAWTGIAYCFVRIAICIIWKFRVSTVNEFLLSPLLFKCTYYIPKFL